ncbi:MAG: BatA domain-containing protein [Verrucomicrobiota bacterium]
MSFLQPLLLAALPLALLPVLIHLIHRQRHRTVRWAAMMFLLDAKKMARGMARLRQILILTMRVIALAALIFAISRPLAGGWVGLLGGARADTVLILLDRSASMEQTDLVTGRSKRSTALDRLADLFDKTGSGANLVVIDSVTLQASEIPDPESLAEHPATAPTDTESDIPRLIQAGLDWLDQSEAGRTDIWLASDLRANDWRSDSARWGAIREQLAAAESRRLFLLSFPELPEENLGIAIEDVTRQQVGTDFQLSLDLVLSRDASDESSAPAKQAVEVTLNGTRTTVELTFANGRSTLPGFVIDLGKGEPKGWGRLDLPADSFPGDNSAWFVYDEETPRFTAIVSDDAQVAAAISAAANAAVDRTLSYSSEVYASGETQRIPWNRASLLVWNSELPAKDSNTARLLDQYLARGRSLLLLPPAADSEPSAGNQPESWRGIEWGERIQSGETPPSVEWWRTGSGLLANTRNGDPLPVNDLKILKRRPFSAPDTQSFLEIADDESLLSEVITPEPGHLYMLSLLPRQDHSSLASDGIAYFVMLHRALEQGANYATRASLRPVLAESEPNSSPVDWLDQRRAESSAGSELRGGALRLNQEGSDSVLIAQNRPITEDQPEVVSSAALDNLLGEGGYQRIDDAVENDRSLAAEIWRAFLIAMALALLIEAILSLPPPPDPALQEKGLSPSSSQ